MPLNGYSSLCEERQRIIVSRDKRTRREHRAVNPDSCHVSQYNIDGNVVSDSSIRCDYLVMNEDRRNAYLIELKGSDIEHALDQLEVTAERLQKQLQGYCIRYRLVCSRVRTQAIRSIKYRKFCKKHNGTNEFICQENQIKESI